MQVSFDQKGVISSVRNEHRFNPMPVALSLLGLLLIITGSVSVISLQQFLRQSRNPNVGATGAMKPITADGCVVSGCNGELCTSKSEATTNGVSSCISRPEYACYSGAICRVQSDGQCGWTQTAALRSCFSQFQGSPNQSGPAQAPMVPAGAPPMTTSPEPSPSCLPRPACLDRQPRCQLFEPEQGWCPKSSPSPHPTTSPVSPSPTVTPSPSASPSSSPSAFSIADLNQDGKVDLIDYSIMVSEFLKPHGPGQGSLKADLNGDGKVNLLDYSIWRNQIKIIQ
jgi:hypothetical protein